MDLPNASPWLLLLGTISGLDSIRSLNNGSDFDSSVWWESGEIFRFIPPASITSCQNNVDQIILWSAHFTGWWDQKVWQSVQVITDHRVRCTTLPEEIQIIFLFKHQIFFTPFKLRVFIIGSIIATLVLLSLVLNLKYYSCWWCVVRRQTLLTTWDHQTRVSVKDNPSHCWLSSQIISDTEICS